MKTSGKYILDGNGNPVPCDDLIEWGRWMEKADRNVKCDVINGVRVSTVFLGLDHGYACPMPLLYETMIFGGEHDQYQERYTTKAEAIEGHERALKLVQKSCEV